MLDTILIIIGVLLLLLCIYLILKNKSLSGETRYLKKSLNVSEKQNKLSQDYITLISKELRTPLYGIIGLTNLLTESYPELKEDKNLVSLKFSGDYLLNLINNILQITYIDSNEITPLIHPFDLKEVTQNLVHSFNYLTENKNNTLHFKFDDRIKPMVLGDAAILSQILMNLISHALRFTRNGNVYCSVRLESKKENKDSISFRISHDGNDISKEDEKSIYEEFINIDKARRTYLGTGLNATIIKKLVSSIDGEISLQNNKSGSEYICTVDFEIPNQDKFPLIEKDGSEKFKALIVDDNKLNLMVADKILTSENFECTTVDNGLDAIEMTKNQKFDIILMDINMPKLNGIGTTKRIRRFDADTPIIALTAVDITQLNKQITQAGLNDYILKPYDKKLLLEKIYRLLKIEIGKDQLP